MILSYLFNIVSLECFQYVWYITPCHTRLSYLFMSLCANKIENFQPHFHFRRCRFVFRFTSSRRINGHYTLIPRVDRISPLIAKVFVCRGWCFHIDQLRLLAVCLVRCYMYNGHFGFEPVRKDTRYTHKGHGYWFQMQVQQIHMRNA